MNTKSTTTNGKLKGLIGIGGAIAISTVSVIAAASFQRPAPPVPAKPVGVVHHEDGIDLSSESPAWKVLKLGQVELAQDRWTDAVPARVKINESRANKLGAPLAGRVIKTHVELGEAVAVGDPLFSVASRDIAELRAELNLADLEVSVAKANLARVQAMVKAGALPAKEEIAARQDHQKAVLARRLAAAKLGATKVSEDSHSEYTVQSPIDGYLVEKRVTSGQEVGPEVLESLATVADLTTVWVVADLFEADAVDVVVGAKAEITSPSLPGVKMEGKVDMVSSVVDPSRHTVPIRVSLENPEGLLRPNIYANVRFETKAKKGLVEIPASALLSDGTVQSVFIEKSTGVFKKQPIVAGSVRGGILPVFEGLEVGDTIVVEGAILLHNAMALAQ
ncbi:MAG TPA: efflux RND transporter periplasmic adaptor subunit [Oligoflexales bacterium]|jgi:RND family efflux transporter MFP subunit|nr:efflux RND transporter periplasmic adaptor subunit [Oligoflexales bacterium]